MDDDNVIKFPNSEPSAIDQIKEALSTMEDVLLIGTKPDGEFTWVSSTDDIQWAVFALEAVKKMLLDQMVQRVR